MGDFFSSNIASTRIVYNHNGVRPRHPASPHHPPSRPKILIGTKTTHSFPSSDTTAVTAARLPTSTMYKWRHSEQKQLAAVGINQAVDRLIDQEPSRWTSLWEQYLTFVLQNGEMDKIQWQHLYITGKALEKLMYQIQGQGHFCSIFISVFTALPLKAKSLIYDTFLVTDTSDDTKYVFLRQTIDSFLEDSLNFIAGLHDSHLRDRDSEKLQLNILSNLSGMMALFSKYKQGKILDLTITLSIKTDLFLIIVEELLFDPHNKHHQSVIKVDFAPERMSELLLYCQDEKINSIKAEAISIFTSQLCQYDQQAGIQQFDNEKILFFMENLTPIVIDKLSELVSSRNWEGKEQIAVKMMELLRRSAKFNFMLQTFQSAHKRIFYSICLPLLETTKEEIELYESNSADFIRISEQILEQGQQWMQENLKNTAAKLLTSIANTINGFLVYLVETSIQTIRSILLQESYVQITEMRQNFAYRPSIDSALLILSIFSSEYQKRQQILQPLREILQIDKMLDLKGIEKARFIIFLAYNYQHLFIEQPQEGEKFLLMAERELDQKTLNAECSLLLFYECLELGFGDAIWNSFINRLTTTTLGSLFRFLNQILEKMLKNLPVQRTQELVSKVIERLVAQFRHGCEQSKEDEKVKGSEYLYLCLDIITTITSNSTYLKEEPSIIRALWPVFGLFQFAQRIEFEDNILSIFNQILTVDKQITHEHFIFIPHFIKIYNAHSGFVDLLQTVTLLLTRGREYLLSNEQGGQDMGELRNFIKCCYGVIKNQDTLKHILIFYHYIYLQYSTLVPFDKEFHEKLIQIYHEQNNQMKDQTKAAIMNYLLIAHAKYSSSDLSPILENRIEIFQGYQAKLFAFGLRCAIEKDFEDNEMLMLHLKCSIRLLHYIRYVNLQQKPHRYFEPAFPEVLSIDPFGQICHSLNFLKRNLNPQRYDFILEQLNNQISLGEIKDLLSRRMVDNSMRTIKRVRQN